MNEGDLIELNEENKELIEIIKIGNKEDITERLKIYFKPIGCSLNFKQFKKLCYSQKSYNNLTLNDINYIWGKLIVDFVMRYCRRCEKEVTVDGEFSVYEVCSICGKKLHTSFWHYYNRLTTILFILATIIVSIIWLLLLVYSGISQI